MANEPSQVTNVIDVVDKIIRWATPIIGAFAALVIFIYRSKIKELETKICEEEKERKQDIDEMKQLIENQFSIMRQLETNILNTFKEGLKEERVFRSDVAMKQSEHIEKLFSKLEDLTNQLSRLDQKVISHIENQEKVCQLHILGK